MVSTVDGAPHSARVVTQDQAVQHLIQRLDDLTRDFAAGPQIILLRGPSGVGKTFTLRSFFNQLIEDRQDTYWAPFTEETLAPQGALTERKWVSPNLDDFLWPSNALPTFSWWGLYCERLTRGTNMLLSETFEQLDVHSVPVSMGWQKTAKLRTKSPQAVKRMLTKVQEIFLEDGVPAALSYVGLDLPFISTLADLGWQIGKSVRQRAQHRQVLRSEVAMHQVRDTSTDETGAQLASAIESLTNPNFPGVLAIEDIQLMRPDLASILNTLTEQSAQSTTKSKRRQAATKPLLIVATVWPEAFSNTDSAFADWFQTAQERGVVEVLDLEHLPEHVLVNIVYAYASKTPEHVAYAVVGKIHNPLFLKFWLTSRAVQRRIRNDAIPETAVQHIPQHAQDILRERWQELARETQEALLCAVTVNPRQDDVLETFLVDVVIAVLQELGDRYWQLDSSEQFWRALDGAVEPNGWCEKTGELQRFTDGVLAQFVREQVAEESYTPEEIAEIQAVALTHVTRWIQGRDDLDIGDEAFQLAAQWYQHLLESAVDQGSSIIELLPPQEYAVARVVAYTGNEAAARDLLEPILPALQSMLGEQSFEFLDVRYNYAWWLGHSGAYDRAADLLDELEADIARWHPVEKAAIDVNAFKPMHETEQQTRFDSTTADFLRGTGARMQHMRKLQNQIHALQQTSDEELGAVQRTVGVIETKLRIMDEVLSDGRGEGLEVTCLAGKDFIAEAESMAEELRAHDLNLQDPLLRRIYELIAWLSSMRLDQRAHEAELWGVEDLKDPERYLAATSTGERPEEREFYDQVHGSHRQTKREFVAELTKLPEYYDKALWHYRELLSASERPEDHQTAEQYREDIERLKDTGKGMLS